jgi:uracil-DNA glycosylase
MAESDDRMRLLRWYVEMGADEAIGGEANDRFAARPATAPTTLSPPGRGQGEGASGKAPVTPPPRPVPLPGGEREKNASAREAAAAATTLEELRAAVLAFEGCALKRTATNTVFADGTPGAPLMIVGEAPGADEDRLGLPFVGRSGQLLDLMLGAIGRDRKRNAYITNILFWRPPGNRPPTDEERAQCLPFVWRHIALANPRVLMLCGGTAAAAILGTREGITRIRGKWIELAVPGLDRPIDCMPTYHPSYLLRTPARKGEAWRDLLSAQSKLEVSE